MGEGLVVVLPWGTYNLPRGRFYLEVGLRGRRKLCVHVKFFVIDFRYALVRCAKPKLF